MEDKRKIKDKGIIMTMNNLIFWSSAVVLGLYLISIYNHYVMLKQCVYEERSNLDICQHRVQNIYDKIIADLSESASFEAEVQTEIAKWREGGNTGVTLESLNRTLVRAEQYPELKTLNLRGKYQGEIVNLEKSINKAANITNEKIREYNQYCSSVPNRFFICIFDEVHIRYIEI